MYLKNTRFADNNDQSQSNFFAMWFSNSTLNIFESIFERSVNPLMYTQFTTFGMKNCIFRYNTPKLPLVIIEYSQGYIDNSEFYNNNATSVYNYLFSSLYITNCSFKNNYNKLYGGAGGVYNEQSYLYIYDSLFENNTGAHGGALAIITNSYLKIENSLILNNRVSRSGGGLYFAVDSKADILNNVIIKNNIALDGGGGIASFDSKVLIANDCQIKNNLCVNCQGGGIWFSAPLYQTGQKTYFDFNLTIKNNVTIKNNYAKYGGGMFLGGTGVFECVLM